MPQFIHQTLEALMTADIKAEDAAYSLTAHIISHNLPTLIEDKDIPATVSAIVAAVDDGRLSASEGAIRLVALRSQLDIPSSGDAT